MEDVVLRERLAKGVVLTLLGLLIWLVRPMLEPIDYAATVTPWTFYGGLLCFTIALVALVTVVYLDETREFEPEERTEPGRQSG